MYQAPILKRYLFVGEDTHENQGAALVTTLGTQPSLPVSSAFSSQTTFDNQLHDFLSAEKNVPLQDIHCEICSRSADCVNCKAARSDSTFVEIGEDAVIKEALQVHKVSEKNGEVINEFRIEYPTYLPLAETYTNKNCNDHMARQATLSLRRKLVKSGKIDDFHSKVMESIDAKQVVIMTDD